MPNPPRVPDLPKALTDRVAFLLQLALARVQALGERALAELGLSGREYGTLAVLEGGSPDAQHRVGAALGVDRTSTVKLLAGLEGRGLVSRVRDPSNRRAYRVTLTDVGEALRAHAAAVLEDCDDRFLASLPADERAQLRVILLRLLEPVR
ncbi:MAG: MarR family winged helix-turn-helix transcriptional regulator [Geodermatophilaceae bacterium]|jgi:DNA-binding MarR family transcriptional regulator